MKFRQLFLVIEKDIERERETLLNIHLIIIIDKSIEMIVTGAHPDASWIFSKLVEFYF